MAASIASLGITPASLFGVALTITMNRIDLSMSLSTGRSLSERPLYLSNANRGIRHIFQKALCEFVRHPSAAGERSAHQR
jgi:hypothetical protein